MSDPVELTASMPAKPRGAFECRPLRMIAYISWIVAAMWYVGYLNDNLESLGSAKGTYFFDNLNIPLWTLLATHALYYTHLVLWRFRPNGVVLLVFLLVWSFTVFGVWSYLGSDFGITVALAAVLFAAYARTWSSAVITLLQPRSNFKRAALHALGMAAPVSVCGLVLTVWFLLRLRDYPEANIPIPITGVLFGVLCFVVLAIATFISWRARNNAWILLKFQAATDMAKE